jgi:flagellar protein FlaJ
MLIAIRSGVPLYNTMASLTLDYGETSNEFRKIVKKINSGVHELDALSDATAENPSQQFRKLLWQVSNALKVGSDVGNVLEALNQEYTKERVDQVRRYGQELSPLSMVYMMFAIILPSLGITMLIVITSFLTVPIPSITLLALFGVLVLFQLFFLNLISTRRPLV